MTARVGPSRCRGSPGNSRPGQPRRAAPMRGARCSGSCVLSFGAPCPAGLSSASVHAGYGATGRVSAPRSRPAGGAATGRTWFPAPAPSASRNTWTLWSPGGRRAPHHGNRESATDIHPRTAPETDRIRCQWCSVFGTQGASPVTPSWWLHQDRFTKRTREQAPVYAGTPFTQLSRPHSP